MHYELCSFWVQSSATRSPVSILQSHTSLKSCLITIARALTIAGRLSLQGQTCTGSSATTSGRRSGRRRRRRWRRRRGGRRRSRWTRWASSASPTSCSRRLGRTRRTFWPSTRSWRGKTRARQSENSQQQAFKYLMICQGWQLFWNMIHKER